MRKYLLIGMLALAGCSTVPSTGDITERAKEIQGYTKLACSFVPSIATIASILSSGVSIPFTAIAADICSAVTTAPLADGGPRQAKVMYNSKVIVLKGSFVK